MSTQYYLWLNEQQAGPYTLVQLRGMWLSGSITGATLYWQEGMAEWLPLERISATLDEQPVQAVTVSQKAKSLTVIGVLGMLIGAA